MIRIEDLPGRPGLAARLRTTLGAAFLLALAGCDSLVEVDNPNTVGQEDLERPEAAAALANGALAATARALGYVARPHSTTSDELVWRGSFDYVGQHNRGELWNDDSQFVTTAFNDVSVARWLSDEGVKKLEALDAEGKLTNRLLLGRLYLYSAINYATAADMFEDFVISDRQQVAKPVGHANMHTLYDTALGRLTKALEIAQATSNADLRLSALAMRARVHWAKALWQKMAPRRTPTDPLIDDAQANAAARELLAAAPADWKLKFTYSQGSSDNWLGNWVNSRLEMAIDAHLIRQDASARKSCSPFNTACPTDGIVLQDPIDRIQDPALRTHAWEFIQGFVYAPMTVVSARELRLILAEGALKRGDLREFATQVNAVRTLEKLTPYDPAVHTAVNARDLLVHMRKVNLFLQVQRRLGDMYRFGIKSPLWIESAEAVRAPGTVLPMSRTENISNCYVVGTCS
jgi:hypothetical protein